MNGEDQGALELRANFRFAFELLRKLGAHVGRGLLRERDGEDALRIARLGRITGPGTQAVSLSLFKSVAFTERIKAQIGVPAANLFNHPNYDVPGNLTVGTSGFAQIGSLQSAEGAGPRSIQLTGRIQF